MTKTERQAINAINFDTKTHSLFVGSDNELIFYIEDGDGDMIEVRAFIERTKVLVASADYEVDDDNCSRTFWYSEGSMTIPEFRTWMAEYE